MDMTDPMPKRFFVGLDLGQAQDFSEIAVVERMESKGEWDFSMFAHRKNVALRLRCLERMPLWTSYPDVVERAAAVTRSAVVDGGCELVVDARGWGRRWWICCGGPG